MITTVTEDQKYDSVISVQMSRAIFKFPIEIVRLVFEASVALGPQARRPTATKVWIRVLPGLEVSKDLGGTNAIRKGCSRVK